MIYAVGRDLAVDKRLEEHCREAVFQQDDPFKNIPERLRIIYDIRDEVRDFVNDYVKLNGGTNNEEKLTEIKKNSPDISVQNMANAILEFVSFSKKRKMPQR